MKKSFNTTVSVKDGTSRSVLKGIVQHDTLNEVNIRLTDGTRPFDYTGYTNIILKVRKADGTSYVDSEGNSVIATNPSGGLITVLLKGQATAAVGLCQCVIEIYAGGEKMTSARLNYEVSASLGTDEGAASESQYPAFQKLLSDLSNIEADATAAGGYATRAEKAANTAEMWAKGSQNIAEGDFATRAELETVRAGAAPAGFGLGGTAKLLTATDNLNDVWQNGYYYWNINPINAPFGYGVMQVVSATNEAIVQEITGYNTVVTASGYGNSRLRRVRLGDNIIEEWDNPQMVAGVEYRTTERFMGKPVYVKLVSLGVLAAGTTTIEHGIENVQYVFRHQGLRGNMAMPSIFGNDLTSPWNCYVVQAHQTAIVTYAGESAAGAIASCILWYTKSTD